MKIIAIVLTAPYIIYLMVTHINRLMEDKESDAMKTTALIFSVVILVISFGKTFLLNSFEILSILNLHFFSALSIYFLMVVRAYRAEMESSIKNEKLNEGET